MITLGAYLLNQESKVRFIVLDNDSEDKWKYLISCGRKLANADIPTYLEKSRRGGHLWMFFEESTNGGGFFTSTGEPLVGRSLREQLYALQRPQFVSETVLEPYKTISSTPPPKALLERLGESTGHVSERLNSRVTILEFISQYVDLKPTESGAIGLCPFHDDQHPSFGVNDKENYWHCFAGCGGGSIIDFWSLWRKKKELDSSFIATITELAEMLF